MDAIIINPSKKLMLNPLCGESDILNLTIMGKPFGNIIKEYLLSFKVDKIFVMKNGDDLPQISQNGVSVLIESNVITNEDLFAVQEFHARQNAQLTVVTSPNNYNEDVFAETSANIKIDRIVKEMDYNKEYKPIGICVVNNSLLLSAAKKIDKVDITSLVEYAIENKFKSVRYVSENPNVFVFSADSYRKCHSDIMNKSIGFKLKGEYVKEGLRLEDDVIIESGVRIETPVYISRGCRIERGAKIGGESFIGENCTVKSNAEISHSVIGKNCTVSENTALNGVILADNVNVGNASVLEEGVIIGSGCRIEEECFVRSGVRIWPNKRITKGTRVNNNLVWGSIGTERLFREGKLYGEVNIDVTPEFSAKLGAAVGTMFCGERIGIGYDSAPVCMMLAKAVMSGVISSGARLFDFGESTLPEMRIGTKHYGLKMSIYINQSDSEGIYYPEIELIEDDGTAFGKENTNKLEGIFFDNVFSRATASNICDSVSVTEFRMTYVQDILNIIKSKKFKINMELRTKSETVSEILEVLLSEIERYTLPVIEKQFITELDRKGGIRILSDASGDKLDKNRILTAVILVLTEHLEINRAAIPVSAPQMIEENLVKKGVEVLRCGSSDEEFMNFLIKNGFDVQYKLCFDGIFFSVALLDYLNVQNISFEEFKEGLPIFIYREIEIECPESKKNEIIKKLCQKYSSSKKDMTEGVKIYTNNGWALILPQKYRHCIKIITEGVDMEAAEELSTIFKNQIKRLAKLN